MGMDADNTLVREVEVEEVLSELAETICLA